MRFAVLSTIVALATAFCASARAQSAGRAVQVTTLRHYVSGDRIGIVVQLNGPVSYVEGTATDPYRIFFDLQGAQRSPTIVSRTIVRDPVLERIRVGEHRPGMTRVVLDLNQRMPYRTTVLSNPPRLLIELLRTASAGGDQPSISHPSRSHAASVTLARSSPPPLPPEQMPPLPPQVDYRQGQLTVVATNCTLASILRAIATQTGMLLDAPQNLTQERVAARLGPASTRSVLTELLAGSDFDYILVGDHHDPEAVRSLVLSRDSSAPAAIAQPVPQQVAQEEVHVLDQPGEPWPAGEQLAGQSANQDLGAIPPQSATPEQLLDDLRRQQQQEDLSASRPN